MASGGYYSYNQNAPYYYQPRAHGSHLSVHLFVFLATVFLLAAASLYARYESAVESLLDQLRLFVILSPVLLIIVVQYWVATSDERRGGGLLYFLEPLIGDQWDSYDQWVGGGASSPSSPWGVALVLVMVLFLVSYQSSFHDWWFPLVRR